MTVDLVVQIIRRALMTILIASSPVLIAGLAVGLAVSIFQAVSQIHEMTLTFIPKIVAIFVVMMIFGSWIIRTVLEFAMGIFGSLSTYGNM